VSDSDFARACTHLGYTLDDRQRRQFALYRGLLVERAAQFNLTAVRDPAGIERRHFLESLALGRLLERRGLIDADGARSLDLGSGAGLPGLPLKIVYPGLRLTLLDASEKRCAFLREVADALELADVTVIAGRAETVGHDPDQRCQHDLVLARAVAPLPVLLEYAVPFLVGGGRLVAQKGASVDREVADAGAALAALNAELEAVEAFQPPDGRPQSVVIVRKTAPTPPQLPRRVGLPSRRPLA
jgi:16S rRNA (guanine527-N7)-methyltransferase